MFLYLLFDNLILRKDIFVGDSLGLFVVGSFLGRTPFAPEDIYTKVKLWVRTKNGFRLFASEIIHSVLKELFREQRQS